MVNFMYRLLLAMLLAGTTLPTGATAGDAPGASGAQLTLLVFETEDCRYCKLFRRDVLPAWEQSPRAKAVALRFVDPTKADMSGLKLTGPIDVVPTVVLVRGGVEQDRLAGYTGRQIFFQAVAVMLGRAE